MRLYRKGKPTYNVCMSVVDEVRSRVDIVEVVSPYVKLMRSGRNYKGLSPFQSERTPSFFVFPETQTFKDFSSGEQGDVFSFLMKKEGYTFGEALRELAQKAGVELQPRTSEQQHSENREEHLREAVAQAAAYFHQLLLSAPQANPCRLYLRDKRHLTDETLRTWQLGYSLMDYHALTNALTGRGFSLPDLVDAGLVVDNEEGRRYDRFRGRLMIPIRDDRDRVVGFGSRSLDGSEPKYMNSPQTPLFDKGHLLFGLNRARATIRNEQVAVLVEGYMDVIGTHQAGFTNVVAGMGTSLTESQLKALKRLTPRMILALDPDAAGNRAVLRGVDVARDALERDDTPTFNPRGVIQHESRLNADIRVAILPEGMDPDEIVLQSSERWRELIAGARPVVDHVIDALLSAHDLNDPHGKSEAIKAVAPIVRDLSDPIRRDYYIQQLARKIRITPRAVAQAMANASRGGAPRGTSSRAERPQPRHPESPRFSDAEPPTGLSEPEPPEDWPAAGTTTNTKTIAHADLESHLVAIFARKPALLLDVNVAFTRASLELLSAEDFTNPALRAGFLQLGRVATGAGQDEASGQTHPADSWPVSDDDWLEMIADVQLISDEPGKDDEAIMREEAVHTALRLREENLRRDRNAVAMMIDDAQNAKDKAPAAQYNRMLQELNIRLLRAQKALRLRSMVTID